MTAHLSDDGHTYMLGSRYTADAMAQVGVGQQIDRSVTYTAPGKYNLTAMTLCATWPERVGGLAWAFGPGHAPKLRATVLAERGTAHTVARLGGA